MAFAGELLGSPDRVAREAHPDLYVLEPLGDQIRIDPIREMRRDLHMRPFEADRRVYIVGGAHLMNEDAADALLKDLEEPPPYAVIVLVADELGPLPETIRSRCQLVPFKRLSRGAVKTHLAARGLSGEELEIAARVAAGRLDRAERLLDSKAGERRFAVLDLARAAYRDDTFEPAKAARIIGELAAGRAAEIRATLETAAEAAKEVGVEETKRDFEQRLKRAERGAERDEVLLAIDVLGSLVSRSRRGGRGRRRSRLELRPAGGAHRGRARGERARRPRGRDGTRGVALVRVQRPDRARARGAVRPAQAGACLMQAVGVVFSPGGRVYSFDPAGLELAWDARVICETAYGQEFARVVKPNHTLEAKPPSPFRKIVRLATEDDRDQVEVRRAESKDAMRVFREVLKQRNVKVKPISVEIAFDGSRTVVSYQSDDRTRLGAIEKELGRRLGGRVELRSVGPRECARLCGDVGLCGRGQCSRSYPSHEQPITLRMAKDQALPVASSRITGLCGRLRCCLAFEHPTYKSFRDRAPRVGRRVETPQGMGVVTGYTVLEDTCTVELEGEEVGTEISIDECRELEGPARR